MEHQMTLQQTRTARANAVLSWFVNPLDPDNAFATINDAFAAADAALPAGEPVVIELAPGKNHALTAGALAVGAGRDLFIRSRPSCSDFWLTTDVRTQITGTFDLADATGAAKRRVFMIEGCVFSGTLNGQTNWFVKLHNGAIAGTINRTHTAGGMNGCFLEMRNMDNNNTGFRLIEQNNPMMYILAPATFLNCKFLVNVAINPMLDGNLGAGRYTFVNCTFNVSGNATGVPPIMRFNALQAAIEFIGANTFVVEHSDATLDLFGGHANSTIVWNGEVVFDQPSAATQKISFEGAIGTHIQAPSYVAGMSPEDPISNQKWLDTRTKEVLTWNGTYWVVGDLVRVETLAGVGGAAADHDLGWNVPAGFAVVKASIRLLKVITGAGGATKVGFGTKVAGDPDKYALTPALTVGNPHQTINPTYNNGAGDDLALTACDNAGAALGTIAGSGTADARTMVWMRPPVTLAS